MLILMAAFPAPVWAASQPALMAEAQALQAQGIGYGGSFTPPGEDSPWRMDCSNAARYLVRQTQGVELPRTASEQYNFVKRHGRLKRVGGIFGGVPGHACHGLPRTRRAR
jgi:cell wall-associated NlpC family hydrolase